MKANFIQELFQLGKTDPSIELSSVLNTRTSGNLPRSRVGQMDGKLLRANIKGREFLAKWTWKHYFSSPEEGRPRCSDTEGWGGI